MDGLEPLRAQRPLRRGFLTCELTEFRRLAASPTVRLAVERRSGGACESCGLAWPWILHLFRVQEEGPNTAANLVALCVKCSDGRGGPSLPLVGQPGLRARVRAANNRRAAVTPLTSSGRRALLVARGARCEQCGGHGGDRPLEVHHKLAVLQGGHDGVDNLQVLCFACHHRLQPCITGCGAWAKKTTGLCRNCVTRRLLESLMPEASWEEVKVRLPGFASQWKAGYEPRRVESE
jgi:5-methylcytosine-specific restriction endonuclease McrA